MLRFEARLLLGVLLLCCKGELDLESLLDLGHCIVLRLSMLFQKLFDLLVFLLLELLKFTLGLFDDFLDFGVDHHLLHLKAHLRLEAKAAELALRLANRQLVVLHLWYRLAARCGAARLAARLIQEPHNLALARELHCEIVMSVQLVEQVEQIGDLIFILCHVHVHRLRQDSADGLPDLISKATTLGGRRSVPL